MADKPTYEELEQQVRELKEGAVQGELDLLEALPVGMAISSPEGDVVDINQAGLRMFGYTSKGAFLKTSAVDHYYDPEDRKRFKALHDAGMARDFETRFVRKDGTVFWATLTSISRPAPGGGIHYINVFQDISARKAATERERHLSRVLRAVRNVNQLITRETYRERLLEGVCDSLVET
ncbi:MAG: PAS domain-containing protein, partial [Deltaproteobacteria bacterium]|nr:PAS domain-containing protein [Deltaproteobacteria bacterium]